MFQYDLRAQWNKFPYFCPGKNENCLRQNDFCSGQNFCLRMKSSWLLVIYIKNDFLASAIFFVLDKDYFIWNNLHFVLDKNNLDRWTGQKKQTKRGYCKFLIIYSMVMNGNALWITGIPVDQALEPLTLILCLPPPPSEVLNGSRGFLMVSWYWVIERGW